MKQNEGPSANEEIVASPSGTDLNPCREAAHNHSFISEASFISSFLHSPFDSSRPPLRGMIACPFQDKLTYKGADIMQKTLNLQDAFLNQARKDRLNVTMFLMNGFQLHGVVKGFDGFTVVLDSEGKQQLIYKHAISTIVPPRPVNLEE